MIALALLLQAATPSPEALTLARRLAERGTLATLLPMLVEKDLADLAAEDRTLTEAQRGQVKAIGHRIAEQRGDQLMQAFARGYAERLSLADLKLLVAAADRPEAARKRAADLPVTMAAMQSVDGVDLKKETAAAACAEAKLLCKRG